MKSWWHIAGPRGASPTPPTYPSQTSVVCVGDSLTYGQGSTSPGGATGYPAVLAGLLGLSAESTVFNRGLPGNGAQDLPDVDYLLASGKQNRLIVMIGTNDIFGGLDASAATTYSRLSTYVAAREASGWIVTVATPTAWLNVGAFAAVMASYVGLIKAGEQHYVDFDGDTLIGNSGGGPDGSYYSDENGHLTNAGYARMAALINAASTPEGLAPTITAAMGVERDASLTGWFRDMWRLDANGVTPERPSIWHNLVEPVADIGGNRRAGQFDAFTSNFPTRVLSGINGRPALRFHGPGNGFYLPNDRTLADFVTASEFVIHAVLHVEVVTGTESAPYDNDGIFSDSATRLGLCVKQLAMGTCTFTAFAYDGATWTRADAAGTIGADTIVSVRLLAGKLGIRVGTGGSWQESAGGFTGIDALTNVLRIGTDSTNAKTFEGLIADVVIRDAWDTDQQADDDAYFAARYGV